MKLSPQLRGNFYSIIENSGSRRRFSVAGKRDIADSPFPPGQQAKRIGIIQSSALFNCQNIIKLRAHLIQVNPFGGAPVTAVDLAVNAVKTAIFAGIQIDAYGNSAAPSRNDRIHIPVVVPASFMTPVRRPEPGRPICL
jgi:hypothetical protein